MTPHESLPRSGGQGDLGALDDEPVLALEDPSVQAVHLLVDPPPGVPDEVGRGQRRTICSTPSRRLRRLDGPEVWKEVQRRKAALPVAPKGIKQAEIESLLASPVSVGEDAPDGDFYARARPLDGLPAALKSKLERIVLVHRLRSVEAMVGFTRFEAAVPDVDGEWELEVRRAALALDTTWVPAVENRGEGVLIAVRRDAIDAWLAREAVKDRGRRLATGFDAWRGGRR